MPYRNRRGGPLSLCTSSNVDMTSLEVEEACMSKFLYNLSRLVSKARAAGARS